MTPWPRGHAAVAGAGRAPLPVRRGDAGTLSLELVIATPMLLLLLALVFAYGRVYMLESEMESGVRDAARSATEARSIDEAHTVARQVVVAALGDTPCTSGGNLTVDVTTEAGFVPGALVTVQASCKYSLSDLGLPGAPVTMHPVVSFSSMLDLNRGVNAP